jgi:hypothetical protein
MADDKTTIAIGGDARDIDGILGNAQLRAHLDLGRPVGLIMLSIAGQVSDADHPKQIVDRLLAGLAPGSYLVLGDGTNVNPALVAAVDSYNARAAFPYHLRSPEAIAALFAGAGIKVTISKTIEVDLWTKLVMNCAYNAVSALTGSKYGRMVALPEIRAVMIDVVHEVVAVAAAKGVRLPDLAEAAIRLADGMPVTISSTAQDLLRGRRTEIDHLNGYVVREGEALGIATPVNRTLNALVKLAESRAASEGPQTS